MVFCASVSTGLATVFDDVAVDPDDVELAVELAVELLTFVKLPGAYPACVK